LIWVLKRIFGEKMRHGKNSAYGRKARREGALERLKASKFTEKMMADGKEGNEKSWTKKKEADIERLEERIKHG
jgi:hypothetical protein